MLVLVLDFLKNGIVTVGWMRRAIETHPASSGLINTKDFRSGASDRVAQVCCQDDAVRLHRQIQGVSAVLYTNSAFLLLSILYYATLPYPTLLYYSSAACSQSAEGDSSGC